VQMNGEHQSMLAGSVILYGRRGLLSCAVRCDPSVAFNDCTTLVLG
jgi:hypothetical protein